MWFMEVHPSHFLITFWYWGAYNDSFWNVRVMTCCVFNNRHLLSLQLWPTLLCEMIFEYKWIGNSLWCEKKRALDWEWMVVPFFHELAEWPWASHFVSLGLICKLDIIFITSTSIMGLSKCPVNELIYIQYLEDFLGSSAGKESTCSAGETRVQFLDWEDPLEKR